MDLEGIVNGTNDPEILEQVVEMSAAYERRVAAALKLAEVISGIKGGVEVDFATYFAHINQLSLEEARAEQHRKVAYYGVLFNGLSPEDVGEPVLITTLTMLGEMGVIGSFSEEEPTPVRHIVGAHGNDYRWGRIELAYKKLHLPETSAYSPTLADIARPLAIADEIARRRHENHNAATDGSFGTKLYIGRRGVQQWVDIKFPGVGDKAVEPLMDALRAQPVA